MKDDEKRYRQTTMSFVRKRKRDSDEISSLAIDQVPPVLPKSHRNGFHFDFSKDPKILEEQKKFLNASKDSGSSESRFVKPQIAFGATSDGRFFDSNGTCSTAKQRKSCSQSPVKSFSVGFKMASGCPIVKEVRRVTPGEDIENSDSSTSKGSYSGSRRLGSCYTQFRAPQIGCKPDSSDSLAQSSEPSTSTGKGDGKKREGWKAHESLKHFEDSIIDLIESEIMCHKEVTGWADVAGLEAAKKALKEIVILPFLRPDIFNGIRAPPKGVLLFGPPGTGKTMIGRCVASQCKATFFNIAASSLTSKWVGEGEKLVRVLFAVARIKQPSIIFIDEIDSLLTSRSESEHESSRRIKTEFLIHLDGVATTSDERLLVLGATNRPQELDDAAKRRFAKRLYIALPCEAARMQIIRSLLQNQSNSLSEDDIRKVGEYTEGYSGADMRQLCAEASMYPVRDIIESSSLDIATVSLDEVRPIALQDFLEATKVVRPTVVEKDLVGYQEWDRQFGSLGRMAS